MADPDENAPKAVAAALGAGVEHISDAGQNQSYHPSGGTRKRLVVKAIDPDGQPFTVTGQNAKALLALVKAGATGVTALEVAAWAFRLAAHCHVLRHTHRLSIITLWERHEGGRHARYVLRSRVSILKPVSG
jgi:hypothetical protein